MKYEIKDYIPEEIKTAYWKYTHKWPLNKLEIIIITFTTITIANKIIKDIKEYKKYEKN